MMRPTPEQVQRHREILEKHPAEEKCACDPAYGTWCAFHSEFDNNMSQRTLDLLDTLGQRALTLHEAIQNFRAYPVKKNHQDLSRAVAGADTLIELYLKEREIDGEKERERLRERREV